MHAHTHADTALPATIDATTMVIRSRRTWWRSTLDITLTLLAWLGFLLLWGRGLRSMLQHKDIDGLELPIAQQLLPTVHDLAIYVLAILLQGLLLLGWARYNFWRFHGKQRRGPIPALSDSRLMADYDLDPASLQRLRTQAVSVVEHACDGSIVQVVTPAPRPQTSRAVPEMT